MAEDVVFLTPGNPPMRGREAFAAASRAMPANVRSEGTSEIQEIQVNGAYRWTKLTVNITPHDGGDPKRRTGHTLSILPRNIDGNRELYRDSNLLSG
jgi:ketosteroid isomerase-like protein